MDVPVQVAIYNFVMYGKKNSGGLMMMLMKFGGMDTMMGVVVHVAWNHTMISIIRNAMSIGMVY